MAKHSASILEWARQGAEARWRELQTEVNSLLTSFPHLRALTEKPRGRRGRRPTAAAAAAGAPAEADAPASQRKRKPMSAAQKKAVGERMRKYWAQRRKAANAK